MNIQKKASTITFENGHKLRHMLDEQKPLASFFLHYDNFVWTKLGMQGFSGNFRHV